MRVLFERTGGFAGMRLTATIDTESLSQKDARELTDMVHAAYFLDLPAVTSAPAPGTGAAPGFLTNRMRKAPTKFSAENAMNGTI